MTFGTCVVSCWGQIPFSFRYYLCSGIVTDLTKERGVWMNGVLFALAATGFTFLMTTLGAAVVFFFKKEISETFHKVFLGFAAGVMIAASVWSLLIPAIDRAEEAGHIGWIPAAGGFFLGGIFFLVLDRVLPHLHPGAEEPEGPRCNMGRSGMLMMAVTLHNIPEGMAVGLSCALAVSSGGADITIAAAMALALGIGIQNFPEGAAISLPLRQEGMSRFKAFLYGSLSGIVEPVAGVITVFIAGAANTAMPWLLSFAAGAMIFVVAEELIPEANTKEGAHAGTMGVMIGFMLMMVLDVALG